jgi:hypothetical protein
MRVLLEQKVEQIVRRASKGSNETGELARMS